jgi:hypothetical protein
VLKLGGSLSICGATGPFIVPGDVFPNSLIYHWLDSEDMTWFHESDSFILGVMRHLWGLMEHSSNTMSCVRPYYGIAQWLNMISNNISTFSIHVSWLTIFDGFHQRVISGLNESSAALTNLSDTECFVHVCMIPIYVATDVKVYNVSLLKGSCVWDSMADALINRGAAGTREIVVVKRRWVTIVCDDVIMYYFVNFLCSHAGGNSCMTCVAGTTSNFASSSHHFDIVFVMNWWIFICELLKCLVWSSSLGIIWLLYMIRNFSLANKRIWEWSQGSSIFESSFY